MKLKILLRKVSARNIRLAEQQQLCERENRGRQPAAAAVFIPRLKLGSLNTHKAKLTKVYERSLYFSTLFKVTVQNNRDGAFVNQKSILFLNFA